MASQADDHAAAGSPAGSSAPRVRRAVRACLQCRTRKQKCNGPAKNGRCEPCARCAYVGTACSFSADDAETEASPGPGAVHQLLRLQREVDGHEQRLRQLEILLDDFRQHDLPCAAAGGTGRGSDEPASPSVSPGSSKLGRATAATAPPSPESDHVYHLDTPVTALRLLRPSAVSSVAGPATLDPVACGLLSLDDAQAAFDLFFAHCHRWGPVLCPHSQTRAAVVRTACPTLLLDSHVYSGIVALWDKALSRLLLQPTPSDMRLDHIRALLLYIQWMPLDRVGGGNDGTEGGSGDGDAVFHVPRYNGVSCWSMLGLAIRYALFLGLHQDATRPFQPDPDTKQPRPAATRDEVGRLRVWIGLLTCDINLMLSSGLPASLNPEPVADVAHAFSESSSATQPDDARVAALCELVTVLKRATGLAQANAGFDAWEQKWRCLLGAGVRHYELPFTTRRAYRLSVNSACLSALLSTLPRGSGLGAGVGSGSGSESGSISLLEQQALQVAVQAAAETLLALSVQESAPTWRHHAAEQHHGSLLVPAGPLTPDPAALERLSYSTDASWVTHSFAVIFLVLCYCRGAIDDELCILAHAGGPVCGRADGVAPPRPAPASRLVRLLSLGRQIFHGIHARTPRAHPVAAHRSLLDSILALFLPSSPAEQPSPETADESLEQLFESILSNADLPWQATGLEDMAST